MVMNHIRAKARALSDTGVQSSDFDYDSYDCGCLRYLLELWILLNRLRKRDGARGCRDFFNTTLTWLTENEELRKYGGQDYTAASMLSLFLFVKLSRMNIEETLDFLSSNKSCMELIGLEKVPTKGAVTKFRKRMGFEFNLMLYVLYGLGFVNILEDMKVEKRSNCVYTPLQINLAYIVKMILGFKNAYGLDEELEDDVFLQMICTLDGDRTPSKSTLDEDIRRYKAEELRNAYRAIIQ